MHLTPTQISGLKPTLSGSGTYGPVRDSTARTLSTDTSTKISGLKPTLRGSGTYGPVRDSTARTLRTDTSTQIRPPRKSAG